MEESLYIQQIRELDFEELEVEEVDVLHDSDENDDTEQYIEDGVTFDTSLASLHTYLGEFDDTRHHKSCYLESDEIVTLPLLFLKGIVLFPGAILPLRVVESSYVAAVLRALNQADVDVSNIIAVARSYKDTNDRNTKFSSIGTTAEILQHRFSEDGSLNLVTRGRQRFTIRRHWINMEGQPYGLVEIMHDDFPSKTPQEVFGKLSVKPSANGSSGNVDGCEVEENGLEGSSEKSFESMSSLSRTESPSSGFPCFLFNSLDESTSSDEDKCISDCEENPGFSHSDSGVSTPPVYGKGHKNDELKILEKSVPNSPFRREKLTNRSMGAKLNQSQAFSSAFWPYWVYRMHDSYHLAERLASMWKEVVETTKVKAGTSCISGLVKNPDLLSFYVASNIVVSDSKRQELLETKGISYRLIREIELLKDFDCIRCKNCQTVIAKRSDMLVMSNEGLVSAYVNPGGIVHQMVTFYRATGLALMGRPKTEYSWFPGYSWTITNCSTCERHVGWVFNRLNKLLKPKLFWGIRSSQIADPIVP